MYVCTISPGMLTKESNIWAKTWKVVRREACRLEENEGTFQIEGLAGIKFLKEGEKKSQYSERTEYLVLMNQNEKKEG